MLKQFKTKDVFTFVLNSLLSQFCFGGFMHIYTFHCIYTYTQKVFMSKEVKGNTICVMYNSYIRKKKILHIT